MNGVMSNIQYMPSPHGQSKRIRLHHSEPFSNPFQGYSDKTEEPDNIEIVKPTHVWMRNSQFKEERNAYLLISGSDAFSEKLNKFSTNGFQENKENLINKNLVSDIYKHALDKDSYSKPPNLTFRDPVVQSLSFSESDLQNTIQKEAVGPSLGTTESNLLNVYEDTNSLSSKPLFTILTQVNDEHIFPSKTILKARFEKCFQGKSVGIVVNFSNENSIPDGSKVSSRKYKPSSRKDKPSPRKDKPSPRKDKPSSRKDKPSPRKEMQSPRKDKPSESKKSIANTSKSSNGVKYQAGNNSNSAKFTPNSSDHCESLENKDDYLYHLEQIKRMKDITIEPAGKCVKYEVDQKKNVSFQKVNLKSGKACNFNNVNTNYKQITISNNNNFHKGNYKHKDVHCFKHFNSETKVLSWKTYSKIVRRLPNYNLFSDVIQSAMRKVKKCKVNFEPISQVKHPKIYIEPMSPAENIPSNKTVSTVTDVRVTEESHENTNTKSSQNTLLHDFDGSTVANVKVNKELHKNANIKSKQDTLLNDLDELDDFLDFVSSKIQEMILLVGGTSNDIRFLETASEDIAIALHHIRNTEYLDERNGKLCIGDINRTRNEILTLGDFLLQKIGSLELDLMDILSAFKTNLVMVSRLVYMLCSIPIESRLTDQRDLVYAAMHQVDNKIKDVEVTERDMDIRRNRKFSEFLELQQDVSRFHRLDKLLDELCEKYFD